MDDLKLPDKDLKPTYERVKQWVRENYGMKVSPLYVAQVKNQLELEKQYKYTAERKHHQPHCPPEKAEAIKAAFEYYGVKTKNTGKRRRTGEALLNGINQFVFFGELFFSCL